MKSYLFGIFFFFKDFIYLFWERGEGREKEREWNINVWSPLAPLHQGPGLQPSYAPDWESNQQLFGSQAHAQSTELHQPGLQYCLLQYEFSCQEALSYQGKGRYTMDPWTAEIWTAWVNLNADFFPDKYIQPFISQVLHLQILTTADRI